MWQRYLLLKAKELLKKEEGSITCIAKSLPEEVALVLIDKVQHCGAKIFAVQENQLVALFLWSDSDRLHESFIGFFCG